MSLPAVPTANISQLTNPTPYLSQISLSDKIPYWITEAGKTVWMELTAIKQLLENGGGATLPGTTSGTKHLYIVLAGHAGGDTYVYAPAAGKDFNLTLEGRPMVKGVEYEVLSAGGFKLLVTGDKLIEGQRYEMDLFQLTATTPSQSAFGALFTGVIQAQTNIFLDSNYFGRLIQIRGGSNRVKVNLSAIEDTPENQVVWIEMTINNTKQGEVATKNGQNIYMNGTSYKNLYMGIGETLVLFRGADGWYVIGGSTQAAYQELGNPIDCYAYGPNVVPATGQLLNRIEYARLWDAVQKFGAAIISDTAWTSSTAYRGCFTHGDGSTTFRVPDFRGYFVRTLNQADGERFHNNVGGTQTDLVGLHSHGLETETNGTDGPFNAQHIFDGIGETGDFALNTTAIQAAGGSETRPKNIGLMKGIKA